MIKRLANSARSVLMDLAYSLRAVAAVERVDCSDAARIREHLDEHGWVLVKEVFTPQAIMEMRERVSESARSGHAGDILSDPCLGWVLLDSNFLGVMRAATGNTPVYFGDSNYTRTYYPGTIGFHKDNPDKERQDGPDWQKPYTIFRAGIYLQDCAAYSGGVSLRDRSMDTVDATVGRPFAVPSLPGDVVIWSHRTTHSGFATRLRLFPDAFVPLPIIARMTVRKGRYHAPSLFFRPLQFPDRMAIFASFGQHDRHLGRYLRYLATRQYFAAIIKNSHLGPEILQRAREAGMDVLELAPDYAEIRVEDLDRNHSPDWESRVEATLRREAAGGIE